MKILVLSSLIALIVMGFVSCGQDGAAIAPGGSGSTIQEVKADCNNQSCI